MKTSASPLNQSSTYTMNKHDVAQNLYRKDLRISHFVGLGISFILHALLFFMLFDLFHNVDVRQDGDSITTIALATFQAPSQIDEEVENPKPKPEKPKKKHRKEIIKDHGKLAKQEEAMIEPTKAPKAKPDETKNEGDVIQTLSYKNGQEDERFAKIKRAIEKRNKYPPMMRKRGLEGEVVVEFIIHKDGRVADIRIIKACRHDPFNTAAVSAIKRAQSDFPTLSFTTRIEIPIVYELDRI